jgi:hypothetical protein
MKNLNARLKDEKLGEKKDKKDNRGQTKSSEGKCEELTSTV